MKAFFCLVVVVVVTCVQCQETVLPSRPPTRPPPTPCTGGDDCGEDECCVATGLDIWFGNGSCRKLRQEGQRCVPQAQDISDILGQGIYHFSCPCAADLECRADDTDTQTNPTCQAAE